MTLFSVPSEPFLFYPRVTDVKDPSVLALFVTLRELGSLLVVKVENIRELCDEGRLVRV